jgi:FkbM family methyltransferase
MKNFNYYIGYPIGRICDIIARIIPAHLRYKLSGSILPQDTLWWSLYNLKLNGFRPKRIIEVGAYRGGWTRACKKIFPSAAIMMIEPHISENKFLRRFCKGHPDCCYVNALVVASEKEKVPFSTSEVNLGSRVLAEPEAKKNNYIELSMTTLDSLTEETLFRKSQLFKLDVQGYELEVLKGAGTILNYVEVIIAEASLIPIISEAPLFGEVIKSLRDLDFRIYDIFPKSVFGNASKGWY